MQLQRSSIARASRRQHHCKGGHRPPRAVVQPAAQTGGGPAEAHIESVERAIASRRALTTGAALLALSACVPSARGADAASLSDLQVSGLPRLPARCRGQAVDSSALATPLAFAPHAEFHAAGASGPLQEAAFAAYSDRRFGEAAAALTEIIQQDPTTPRWREMRAQVRCKPSQAAAACQAPPTHPLQHAIRRACTGAGFVGGIMGCGHALAAACVSPVDQWCSRHTPLQETWDWLTQ
jgi:hypothetical protein